MFKIIDYKGKNYRVSDYQGALKVEVLCRMGENTWINQATYYRVLRKPSAGLIAAAAAAGIVGR